MNRASVAVALVAACGGKKSDDDEVIAKLRSIADVACACAPKDKSCGDKAMMEITAFDGNLGRKLSDNSTSQKTVGALRDRFFECYTAATVGRKSPEPAKPVEPPKPVPASKIDVAKLPTAGGDVAQMVAAVRAAVAAFAPDIGISHIRAAYVRKDGSLDPTYGKLELELSLPAVPDVVDDPNRPTGAPLPEPGKPVERVTEQCPRLTFEQGAWTARDTRCSKANWIGPRCSLATIWTRALAQGAPDNALAQISLRDFSRGPKWHFTIKDDVRKVDYKRFFDDDCSPDKPEGAAKPNPFDKR